MKNNLVFRVIGLMSGTSLDGLDIVLCEFVNAGNNKWSFEIKDCITQPYPDQIQKSLERSTTLSAIDLARLDIHLGKWFGEEVNKFINGSRVDFIASHGHTVFHQPENKLTKQIGDGHQIHVITGLPIVFDFRSLDVSLGGQGAPLVPIGDKYLFSEMDYCINLGGIANVSFDDDLGWRRAFDIAPCNMLLNYLANKHGLKFDDKGGLARQGANIQSLLTKWNELKFYTQNPPKSLGYEWVKKIFFEDLDNNRYRVEDLMCTAVNHITDQIKKVLPEDEKSIKKILISGGGVKNTFLIETLNNKLHGSCELIIPDSNIIDYKEAVIFAFLGVLRRTNSINCLASVTGAQRDSSSGMMIGF